MDTKAIAKCRGKKLVGIRQYRKDPYRDTNYEGLILEFSNGHIIHITADVLGHGEYASCKINVENENDIKE